MKNIGIKSLLLVIIFLLMANESQTAGWTAKANFGGTARQFATGFALGNKGYIGTGWDQGIGYRNDFWEFDPATNTWTQKANFSGGQRILAVGFAIGSKGYIATGQDFVGRLKDLWEFNPATNTWAQKANFGGASRSRAVAFSTGSKGYIGTGYEDNTNLYYSDFWEYNPSNDTWTQKANFAGGARREATGFSIGNKGYLGTGYDGSQYKNDFWQYDPATDSWTQKADLDLALWEAVGFSIGSKGYCGIGYSVGKPLNDCWEYDTVTNSWTKIANFGGSARFAAVGFAIGSKGYVGTGLDNAGTRTKDFWEYAPNLISTGNISTSQFCVSKNQSILINVPYSVSTNFNTGNVFTAQLSDSTGSFASPQNIGTKADTLGGTINATIPQNQSYGSKYRIRVVSSNPAIIGSDNSKNLTISPNPVANFTINDTLQCLKGNVFNFSNFSTIASGYHMNIQWSFGDGNTDTVLNPVHSYHTNGTYQIMLVNTTQAGCKDTATSQVVVNSSPVTAFSINDTVQCLNNNNFTFTNLSTINTGTLTYYWNFGNSVTSFALDTSIIYSVYGNYHVHLTATSWMGCSDTSTLLISVKPEPIASFTLNDTIQCFLANNFHFTNTSSIATGTFSNFWHFGDSTISFAASPFHTYNHKGSFDVKLFINSIYGCKDSFVQKVTVYPDVEVLSTMPAEHCGSGILMLGAIAKNGYISWYDTNSGGVKLDTGNVFTTDTLHKSKSYYIEASNGVCVSSPRIKVEATIIDIPSVITTTTADSNKGPGYLTLYAKSLQGDVLWYDSATGGTLLDTGEYFTTPLLSATKTYYAEAVDRGCASGIRTAVTAYILPVSINENYVQAEFFVYPNPATSEIILKFTGSKPFDMLIINNLGEVMTVQTRINSEIQNINIESLEKGIYFIILSNENERIVRKFVKN